MQKITPIFDTVLSRRLQSDDGDTLSLLSDAIAQILQQASQKHPQALGQALQGVVSEAISREIEKNRTKIIDALYPIIGSMITKYVTQSIKELTERINQKIESSLSIQRYRRKLKARMSGISESELLLRESSAATLQALFVIHKESGLLISEAQLRESEIDDPHMVASMASAIKDFINDWVERQQEQKSEVQIVSYGDATLYIESAGTVYLIAFFDAEPNYEQRKQINRFFAEVLTEYRPLLQHFDGDYDSPDIERLSSRIERYLQTWQQDIEHAPAAASGTGSTLGRIVLGTLLVLLLLYYGFGLLGRLERSSTLEQMILRDTGIAVDIDDHGDYLLLQGTIHSLDDAIRIRELLEKESATPVHNALHIPAEDLAKKIQKLQRSLREPPGQTIRKADSP